MIETAVLSFTGQSEATTPSAPANRRELAILFIPSPGIKSPTLVSHDDKKTNLFSNVKDAISEADRIPSSSDDDTNNIPASFTSDTKGKLCAAKCIISNDSILV